MKSKTTEKGTAIKIEFSKGKSIRQTLKQIYGTNCTLET